MVKAKVASKKVSSGKLTAKASDKNKILVGVPKGSVKAKTLAGSKQSNERIGILGGAFNPIHIGHLNAAHTVIQELKLKRVLIVPAFRPPHRELVGPDAAERLKMVEIAVKPYNPELEASSIEIDRGGVSYTVDTLRELGQKYKKENIFFILGADAFAQFSQWMNFEELITLANFVVTSRPGSEISLDVVDLPQGLERFVKTAKENKIVLTSGMTIQKIQLEDLDISATEVRKKIRDNGNASRFLPPAVLEYIESKKFYKRTSPLVKDYRKFALFCARRALDKKALGLKLYDMTAKNSYTDYSLVCSATSNRQAGSIAQGILEKVRDDFGLTPISIEGMRDGLWVLIDFGSVIVHIFQDSVREQYKLEELWKNSPQFQEEAFLEEKSERILLAKQNQATTRPS